MEREKTVSIMNSTSRRPYHVLNEVMIITKAPVGEILIQSPGYNESDLAP